MARLPKQLSAAEARTRYWKARMKLHSAIESADKCKAFPEGLLADTHPDHERDVWMCLVTAYGKALASSGTHEAPAPIKP